LHDTCLSGHIFKGSVPSIPVELILTPIADEQIDIRVIVIITGADALSPAAVNEIRLLCDIVKSTVASIPVEVIGRFLTFGETFQYRSIDLEDIQEAIVVIVQKRYATTRGLEQILISLLTTKHRDSIQPCLPGDICESDLERFSLP
jgi:hypothetical protein